MPVRDDNADGILRERMIEYIHHKRIVLARIDLYQNGDPNNRINIQNLLNRLFPLLILKFLAVYREAVLEENTEWMRINHTDIADEIDTLVTLYTATCPFLSDTLPRDIRDDLDRMNSDLRRIMRENLERFSNAAAGQERERQRRQEERPPSGNGEQREEDTVRLGRPPSSRPSKGCCS